MQEAILKLQSDPILHVEQIQGVKTLEPYQRKILEAVRDNERVCISAAHDLGKSFVLAKTILWLTSCFPGTKVISTAPTFTQVEKILWSEIKHGYNNSKFPLGGEMLQTQWKIDDDWFAIGLSPQNEAGGSETQGAGSTFQGYHAEQLVIVFDEATGIHPKRWVQAEGMLTSQKVKFLAIGNPTSRNTDFYRCFSDPQWHKIYLSCFDSPNLIVNGFIDMLSLRAELDLLHGMSDVNKLKRLKKYKVVQPKLLTSSWVMGRALKWGLEHPLFVSKVLGNFPDEDDNALIRIVDVEAAQSQAAPEDPSQRSIGVDPARFGMDSTVITVMEGSRQTERIELVKNDTAQVTGQVVRLLATLPRKKREVVVIDATGIGSGVVDQLKERRQDKVIPSHIEIREVHFGEGCPDKKDREYYSNLKAFLYVKLAEDIKSHVSLLPDNVYLEELPAIIYKFDSKGRYVIESKDDYKRRTGLGSPDSADSLALANYGRYPGKRVGTFTDAFANGVNRQGNIGTISGGLNNNDW